MVVNMYNNILIRVDYQLNSHYVKQKACSVFGCRQHYKQKWYFFVSSCIIING